MDSTLPHLWAGAFGRETKGWRAINAALAVQIYGGVARSERGGKERGGFGLAWSVSASLWPFGRSREPPLPETGLPCVAVAAGMPRCQCGAQ